MSNTSHSTRASKILSKGGVVTVRRDARSSPAHAPLDRLERAKLARRGQVVRVGRGVYQSTARQDLVGIHPYKAIAGVLAGEPYFISWWSALAFHGLTEQQPLTIHVAVQSQHRPQMLASYEVNFVRLVPERFIGIRTVDLDGVQVRIASPERAVIACLDRPDLGGGLPEVVRALINPSLDHAALVRLAGRYPSHALARRLGYLMSVLEVGDPEPLRGRRGRSGYTPLDAALAASGAVDTRWQVLDNVGAEVIRRWAARDT
jgi:predicted transcriptional regulator of viral defense system